MKTNIRYGPGFGSLQFHSQTSGNTGYFSSGAFLNGTNNATNIITDEMTHSGGADYKCPNCFPGFGHQSDIGGVNPQDFGPLGTNPEIAGGLTYLTNTTVNAMSYGTLRMTGKQSRAFGVAAPSLYNTTPAINEIQRSGSLGILGNGPVGSATNPLGTPENPLLLQQWKLVPDSLEKTKQDNSTSNSE